MRSLIALVLTLALVAPALAATPFTDLPTTHWSYDAIQRAVDAGILQGYDGTFHGARLLNRYQMAVIVAKLLEAVKTPVGKAAAAADPEGLAGVEALAVEFAAELALLDTKVTTLEGTTRELKKDLEAMKSGGCAAGAAGLGFSAFAQFGLVKTDDERGVSRYLLSPDSLFFTLPQVSVGVDREVNPGVYFHAQFDYASDVNATPWSQPGEVGINEAYFVVDELLGDVGGKVGAFALPFSMEHNGPFRTCTYTITPSSVNCWNELWRVHGVEFQRTKDVEPADVLWKVGIVSGSDAPTGDLFLIRQDIPVRINGLFGEQDTNFGFYLWVGTKPQRRGLGWNLSYFDNGGDGDDSHARSPLLRSWQAGVEWWGDKLGVLGQYLDGSYEAPVNSMDWTSWYLLVNFELSDKDDVSLRYGSFSELGSIPDITDWTFAFNHKVTENSLIQFEYLTPDIQSDSFPDPKDDLFQLRYRVHF